MSELTWSSFDPTRGRTYTLDTLLERASQRAQSWRARFDEAYSQTDDIWKAVESVGQWISCADCNHEVKQRVVYQTAGGPRQRMQCARCGWLGNWISMIPGNWPAAIDVSQVYSDARTAMQEYVRTLEEQQRKDKSAKWWRWYNAYLQTPLWKRKHSATLDRDNHQCTARLNGCTGYATQVHHLSYKHVGNEPLFELISVCENCHKLITEMDSNG